MLALVFDLETSIKNRGDDSIGKFKAAPWFKDNKIVATGWRYLDNLESENNDPWWAYHPDPYRNDKIDLTTVDLLVGFNIKFDLHYWMRDYPSVMEEFYQNGGKIWDCQLAEYILSGQVNTYPDLNTTAPKYGGTEKDDRIKEFWDNDIDTEEIPKDMLIDYLKDDVLNTEKVFLGQLEKAEELGMLDLIISQMDGLLATTEMEFNGLWFDKHSAHIDSMLIRSDLNALTIELSRDMKLFFPEGYEPNPFSNDDLSKMLFGGTVVRKEPKEQVDEDGNVILLKSGRNKNQPKTKLEDVEYNVRGFSVAPKKEWETKKKGVYQVNDAVLNKLLGRFDGEVDNFISKILKARELKKDLVTYYEGLCNLTWPVAESTDGGLIHGSINHCSTVTGRLSSNSPNLQNVSGS